MMKPKAQTEHEEGMLEFLEDIIGSSRYQEPIDLLTQRVETLNELRGEKVWQSSFISLFCWGFPKAFHFQGSNFTTATTTNSIQFRYFISNKVNSKLNNESNG